MRIVHAVGYYYPFSKGGTEAFIHGLSRELIRLGHDVIVLTPRTQDHSAANFEIDGVRVVTFGSTDIEDLEEDKYKDSFFSLLKRLLPDIYHQHTITPVLNTKHLQIAFELGIKTVYTGHIPGVLCSRGDLLRLGSHICSGRIEDKTCTTCRLQHRGVPKILAPTVYELGRKFRHLALLHKKAPVLFSSIKLLDVLKNINHYSHRIVALSQGQVKLYEINGIAQEKIAVVRQAIESDENLLTASIETNMPVRIGFIGRFDPIKGLHLLIDEVLKLPVDALVLEIVGLASIEHESYVRTLKSHTSKTLNIRWLGSLQCNAKNQWFAELDYLCIPSLILETGPIVALEAFAQKVPVLGSSFGGIAETIEHNKNGLLFNPLKKGSLNYTLLRCINEPALKRMLQSGITKPQTLQSQAKLILEVYYSTL